MQRFLRLAILALFFAASVAQAQTSWSTAAYHNCVNEGPSLENPNVALTGYDIATTKTWPGSVRSGLGLLSRIDKAVIREFRKAWNVSSAGTNGREGLVLIFRMPDGSYTGRSQGSTGEYQKFTFNWIFNAVAIVHTHPNDANPRPSPQDQRVAEKYEVPIFTITITGMYVYNPATKIISKVMNGLDWLNPSKWTNEIAGKLESSRAQIAESSYKQIPGDLSCRQCQ